MSTVTSLPVATKAKSAEAVTVLPLMFMLSTCNEVRVPTLVRLANVSIAASIVASVVASKASILLKVAVPLESDIMFSPFIVNALSV